MFGKRTRVWHVRQAHTSDDKASLAQRPKRTRWNNNHLLSIRLSGGVFNHQLQSGRTMEKDNTFVAHLTRHAIARHSSDTSLGPWLYSDSCRFGVVGTRALVVSASTVPTWMQRAFCVSCGQTLQHARGEEIGTRHQSSDLMSALDLTR